VPPAWISDYEPPYRYMAQGWAIEATQELERRNLVSCTVTRDLRLCEEHANQIRDPGSGIVTE
jgi:hypothetical protein